MRLPGVTLAQRMTETGNRSTGFDYMRLFLAVCVMLWHTVATCYGQAVQDRLWIGPYRAAYIFMLPMFFALSGFLVSASLERCRTPISFLGLRILRIFPALVVEILLCVLVLGPVLTRLRIGDYISSDEARAYALNIFGLLHRGLPGVFENNPLPGLVNGQLWTVRAEIMCYAGLAVLSLASLRYRTLLQVLFVTCQGALVLWLFLHPGYVIRAMNGVELALCFMAGACLYRFRRHILWHWSFALLAFLGMVVLLSFNCGTFLVSIPAAYVTIWLGLLSPPKPKWLQSADYSYGVYLYSFPIQQAVASLAWTRMWYINGLISLPLTLLAAAVSWSLLEKHAMAYKKAVHDAEGWALAFLERRRPAKPALQAVPPE